MTFRPSGRRLAGKRHNGEQCPNPLFGLWKDPSCLQNGLSTIEGLCFAWLKGGLWARLDLAFAKEPVADFVVVEVGTVVEEAAVVLESGCC